MFLNFDEMFSYMSYRDRGIRPDGLYNAYNQLLKRVGVAATLFVWPETVSQISVEKTNLNGTEHQVEHLRYGFLHCFSDTLKALALLLPSLFI